ncbi:fumarylacetoacetate hydrolase family protein [Frigidibacter sp. MR17.14]|uniref:fumarylacetoacetate hydrolase family protein n=1 Tax=Frigidibacter sp. MR17.14 TaxID=3126509 RepID=UPI003012F827
MSDYLFPPPEVTALSIRGESALFPVRRIFCVGRNYAEHAREMGHDPDREPPFFFSKPRDALAFGRAEIPFPPQTADLHYEGELVIALGAGGADVPAAQALDLVAGYAIGNDLTRRDLQAVAKKAGRPWDLAKGFDFSAVISDIVPVAVTGREPAGRITSRVNGEVRQDSELSAMIWPVADVIAFLSQSVTLAAGDLIFTGTPAGVGKLEKGDVVEVEIDGLGTLSTKIV